MKNIIKRSMLISIFSLCALNVGTAQPASPSSIASRLKVTGQQWMHALQQYSPHMTPQQKQRLITLTKTTGKLIAAFLVVFGTAYAVKRFGRRKTEPASPAIGEPVFVRKEKPSFEDPAAMKEETAPAEESLSAAKLLRSVRPETETETLEEMLEKQRRAREEAETGRPRSQSNEW